MSDLAPTLCDAALEAIAVFLRSSGLGAPANALDAVRQQAQKDGAASVSDAKRLLGQLRALTATLEGIRSAFEGVRLDPRQYDTAEFGSPTGPQAGPQASRPGGAGDTISRPSFASLVARPSLQMAQASIVPSAHYVLQRCAEQPSGLRNFDPSVPEQYRDDHDPGYRVQEVSEAQLAHPGAAAPAELATANFGGGDGGGDDDELFNAGGMQAPAVRSPVTPRSFSGFVKEAGTAMLAALGVGGADPQALRADAAGNAMRRRNPPGTAAAAAPAAAPAADRRLSLADALSAAPAAPGAALPPVLAAATPSPAFGGADDAPTFGTPEVASPSRATAPPRPSWRHPDSGDAFYPKELDGAVYDCFSLRVVFERGRTGFEESKELPIRENSVVAARFRMLEHLGTASFSTAVKCLDMQTNRLVCMKIIRNDKDILDQSLDEIKLLRIIKANAQDIDAMCCLDLVDYFYFREHLIIVTELLRENLYDFSRANREHGDPPYFTLGRLQRIARQVLTALDYVHGLSLIHADLKPENILMKSHSRCEVKVIDFGSSCFVGDYLTSYVQSRSYRAPEVILGLPYDQKIDLWSLGCVLAELWTGSMLFPNDSVQSLLARMASILGPFPPNMLAQGAQAHRYFTADGRLYQLQGGPQEEAGGAFSALQPPQPRRALLYLPKHSSLRQRMRTEDERFVDFLGQLLRLDPTSRLTAQQALSHPWLSRGLYSDGL